MKMNGVMPLAASFAEQRIDHKVPDRPYSEHDQRGIFDPNDLLNPLYMSPTHYGTSGGDTGQDEAH